ncbi:hypothetical protein LLH00_05985 [bacterium]|nr:hypothetical protein [bacterium]
MNFEYGPCQVTFKGVDLGFTKGGVKVDYATNWKDIEVDQSPLLVDNKVQSERIVVTVPMAEAALSKLADLFPTGTKTVDGQKIKVEFGGKQVSFDAAGELVLTPCADGAGTLSDDANEKITVYKAFPRPQFSKTYSLDDIKVVPVEFHGMMDTTKAAGKQLFVLGDVSAA